MVIENNFSLDHTDLAILRLMQDNARISNVDLAKALDLVPSAVLERVKKLERKNVIIGYNAKVNPVAVDLKLLAFISMKSSQSFSCNDTASELAKIPDVQEVHVIAGDDCFLVKVRTTDAASLMALVRHEFSKIPNILSMKTTIVLETVKEQQQLVIPQK
ncbi:MULTISPECIES: Lrp/AsnC family transcriptional regulator [Pedobacter]|uniref:Leucine-responsive regulatory protein n=1 Tax=Pedobacter zeae TaxID=1737356 RepID=A0A7W6K954_9SPHI|nr:Lrp/AsnC family transcriptional regulator [Pedobacter zeae]MBB4106546.1 Lrp/AsnC family leucine-responsive transcriptional regulator [Pedobacter zeae]GGH02339.1 leucine-responsive regulatory protein [Pedobacter zeae]